MSEGLTPEARWFRLTRSDLAYAGEKYGVRVWRFPGGDSIAITFLNSETHWGYSESIPQFMSNHRAEVGARGVSLVECQILTLSGFQVVRTITKIPQVPHGMSYIGSLTIPFAECSYELKVRCEERGATGIREAVLLDQKLRDGTISADSVAVDAATTTLNSDAPEYDHLFPDHPLSRLRRHLQAIPGYLRLDDCLHELQPYEIISADAEQQNLPHHIRFLSLEPMIEVIRLRDGRLHVCKRGGAPYLLQAQDAVLVSGPLADLLRSRCAASASFTPVAVVQTVTGQSWPGYFVCMPHREVTRENIATLDASGDQLWHSGPAYTYVSPALAAEIADQAWSEGLLFTPGFGMIL